MWSSGDVECSFDNQVDEIFGKANIFFVRVPKMLWTREWFFLKKMYFLNKIVRTRKQER